MKSLSLLSLLLALSANAAIIGERPVSAPLYGKAPSPQFLPTAASDGTNVLAVWHDERSLNGGLREFYAARISPSGELLDPTGIRIAPAGWTPAVVFAGDSWSIFWLDSYAVTVGQTTYNYTKLSAARVSRDGEVIDPPHLVADKVGTFFDYAAASNGHRIVLAARDHLLLFDDHTQLLERVPLPVMPGTENLGWIPLLQSNGSTFLVAWGESNASFSTVVMPLDASGHPSGPPQPANRFGFLQFLASDGRDYLMVVSDGTTVTATPVSATGVAGESQTFALPQVFAVGWNGSAYVVLSRRRLGNGWPQPIDALRLDRSGKPLDPAPVQVADMFEVNRMAIASAGGKLIAVSEGRKRFEDDGDIHAQVIDAGLVAKEILASRSAAAQTEPAIASSGNTHLVVWRENNAWFMNLFSADGTPRFPSGAPLPAGLNFAETAVVFDGTNFVVAGGILTGDDSGTHALRIAPDSGAILDPAGVKISAEGFIGAGAGDGTLLVTLSSAGLRATRLDAALGIAITAIVAPLGDGAYSHASIAWNGSQWLIAYAQPIPTFSPHFTFADARALRITRELLPLDAHPVDVTPTVTSGNRPVAASDGDGFAVFWIDTGTSGRRIARDGTLGPVVQLAGDYVTGAVWDGRYYALAMTGVSARVTHVTAALEPLGDIEPLAPAGAAGGQGKLARTNDRVIAAYVRRGLEAQYGGVPRAFIRTPVPLRPRAVNRR